MICNSLLKFPKRYYVILMIFVGNTFYALTNTSIVIVDLTSSKKIEHDNGTIEIREPEYNWTSSQKGVILSMNAMGHFFAGFTGTLISRLGGARCLAFSKTMDAIISLTAPLMINTHTYLFIANRFALGFFDGICSISCIDIFAHWAPLSERVRLVTYAHLGGALGGAITHPLSGFVIQNFGWKYLFYIFGVITLLWNFVWIIFVSNDPSKDKFISEGERAYLAREISHIAPSKEKIVIPYRSIFTSVPVYALLNEFFISMFTSTFMHSLLPLYVKDVYNANTQTVGLISGIPELSAFVIRPFFAYLADYFRSKPGYSVGKIHKTFLFWGQSLTVVFFLIAAVWNHLIGCIVCLTLARISFGISQISYGVITIDVCGQYAAFMHSVAVFFFSTTNFINPLIAGFLVQNHDQTEWNIYFFLISFLTMYGVIVFVIFGSGDLQPWAKIPDVKKDVDNTEQEKNRHDEVMKTFSANN